MTKTTFDSLPISKPILRALSDLGFEYPTPIQEMTLPPMLDWFDVIAKAPTGTGKTCAFGVPILEHLDYEQRDPQALILAPTRELAIQIADDMCDFAKHLPKVRVATIYGGQNIHRQFDALKKHPQIVVATPGRLMDHMERGTIRIDAVHTAILDEADRMLDMGFVHDVRKILDCMPDLSQLALFSATMSREVMDIAWLYQRADTVELTVPEDEANRPDIRQYKIYASGRNRMDAIADLIRKENHERVLIFCNTKHMVETVKSRLKEYGLETDAIHGDIQQRMREKVIDGFRAGRIPILVATDVAARGLDIDDVDAVFNYDIPNENESYTHRIGRTGRAKKTGVSYTFVSRLTEPQLEEIQQRTHNTIETLELHPRSARKPAAEARPRQGRPGRNPLRKKSAPSVPPAPEPGDSTDPGTGKKRKRHVRNF